MSPGEGDLGLRKGGGEWRRWALEHALSSLCHWHFILHPSELPLLPSCWDPQLEIVEGVWLRCTSGYSKQGVASGWCSSKHR